MPRKRPSDKSVASSEIKLPGNRVAVVVTEKDPQGCTHSHPVVKTHLDVMHDKGTITKEMLEAGKRFHAHFTIANLNTMRSMPLIPMPSAKGPMDITERQNDARKKIKEALDHVGGPSSPSGSCVWHVVGLEHSVRQWCMQQSWTSRPMNPHNATGVLVTALDLLARHYGYLKKSH